MPTVMIMTQKFAGYRPVPDAFAHHWPLLPDQRLAAIACGLGANELSAFTQVAFVHCADV